MMFGKSIPSNANAADAATTPVEHALQSNHRVADRAPDKLSSTAQDLAQRGVDAVRDRSLQARDQALRASDGTLNYIKDEPVKAVLIAAAAGAALMALVGLLRKST